MHANLKTAFDLVNSNFSESEITTSGSKANSFIIALEEFLNVKLPASYIQFVEKMGFGGANSLMVFGIVCKTVPELETSGVGWLNLKFRKDFDTPKHIFLINDVGDGSYYALDLSQMDEDNECPVVIWPLNGYEDTPVLEIVAKDFGEFFLNKVKEQIAMKNE